MTDFNRVWPSLLVFKFITWFHTIYLSVWFYKYTREFNNYGCYNDNILVFDWNMFVISLIETNGAGAGAACSRLNIKEFSNWKHLGESKEIYLSLLAELKWLELWLRLWFKVFFVEKHIKIIFYYFLKIIFEINTSKRSKNIK